MKQDVNKQNDSAWYHIAIFIIFDILINNVIIWTHVYIILLSLDKICLYKCCLCLFRNICIILYKTQPGDRVGTIIGLDSLYWQRWFRKRLYATVARTVAHIRDRGERVLPKIIVFLPNTMTWMDGYFPSGRIAWC